MEKGTVHGRFQPFHNGHLDYVLQAFDRVDFVSVGLTQIFRPRRSDVVDGRNSVEANPLSFFQRGKLVAAALEEAGIGGNRFEIVPFPIEDSTRLNEFVPRGTTCFTTALNLWNSEKIRLLEREGYDVIRLKVSEIDDIRVATGTTIRSLIRAGNTRWQELVPPAVSTIIADEFISSF